MRKTTNKAHALYASATKQTVGWVVEISNTRVSSQRTLENECPHKEIDNVQTVSVWLRRPMPYHRIVHLAILHAICLPLATLRCPVAGNLPWLLCALLPAAGTIVLLCPLAMWYCSAVGWPCGIGLREILHDCIALAAGSKVLLCPRAVLYCSAAGSIASLHCSAPSAIVSLCPRAVLGCMFLPCGALLAHIIALTHCITYSHDCLTLPDAQRT